MYILSSSKCKCHDNILITRFTLSADVDHVTSDVMHHISRTNSSGTVHPVFNCVVHISKVKQSELLN